MTRPGIQDLLSIHLEAAEIMQHGVIFLDREGNILFVNFRFAQLLGYSRDDFKPKTIFQIDPSLNLVAWKKRWKEITSNGQVEFDTEYLISNGKTIPARIRGILLKAGGESYFQAIMQTDDSDSIEDLYLSRFCLDNVNEMITWANPDGSIFYANQAIRKTLGYEAGELLDLSITDLEPNFSTEDWKAHWTKLKEKGSIRKETALRTKSGMVFPVDLSLHYMNYNGREYEMAFVRDLRHHYRREEFITLSFHTFDQSAEMIYWLEPGGRFYYFNDTFLQKSGYKESELLGASLVDIIPSMDDKQFEANWKKLYKQKVLRNEEEFVCKDGSTIPVESTISLIRLGDKEYACTILRDITERKKREGELKRLNREKELLNQQLQQENIILKEEIEEIQGVSNIISKSDAYKPILQQVRQVADTDATVLILGETGTGKELLANAIYQLSKRSEKPFIKVNCGALPGELIESELFGHEKGSFTGAFQEKKGRFELAHLGTIFLDEIGEIPMKLQTKLLRVLQEGEFQRIGSNETIKVDVRIIAATNRDLEEQAEQGNFRKDLFYRLNVFPIVNIPLRERKEDIPFLIRHFVKKYNTRLGRTIEEIPLSVMNELMEYEYPGNVRELENLIERAIILSPGKKLVGNFQFNKSSKGRKKIFDSLEEIQRKHILDALKRCRGKVTGPGGAAELLKLKDKTLYSKMTRLGIRRKDYL